MSDTMTGQRWVAFGFFSTHSRLHGSSSYRVPWQYGEDAATNMARFLNSRHRLMPYLLNFVCSCILQSTQSWLTSTPGSRSTQ